MSWQIPKWKGSMGSSTSTTPHCLQRSSPTNREEATEAWLTGVKANLAHKPAGGIYSGKCAIALGNTYDTALLAKNEKNPEQQAWTNAIHPLFPTQPAAVPTSTSRASRSPNIPPTRPRSR